MMIVTQYFDVLKDLGSSSKNSTVFIPHTLSGDNCTERAPA